MKKKPGIVLHIAGWILILALLVAVIMWLWNLIIPSVIGWGSINYWQALGMAVLFRLLTGHFFMPGFHGGRGRHFHDRFHGMSGEERKAFIRERLRRFGCEEDNNGQ